MPRWKPFTKWNFSGALSCLPPASHFWCFSSNSGSRPNHVTTSPVSDFVVHTLVASHRLGCDVTNFYRENTLRLEIGDEVLYPDCAFLLRTAHRREFGFLIELDNGTERVRTSQVLGGLSLRRLRWSSASTPRGHGHSPPVASRGLDG